MFKNLQMDFNLNHLKSFIVVARTGNLSMAAKELGTTQPNLGRQMTTLEKEVNLVLFARYPRGLDLTKQGQEFLSLCQDIIGSLAQGTSLIKQKDSDPEGGFHFVSGAGLLEAILENVASFSEKHPKLSFTFSSTVNPHQLQIGEADAAVMPVFQTASNSDFIQRPLYNTTIRVYASPNYLQLHSKPETLKDLQFHNIVVYGGEKQEAELNKQIINEKTLGILCPFMTVGTTPAMRTALVNGAGIGCFAYDQKIIEEGLLVDVFPDSPRQNVFYYYTYHRRLEGSPKIEAFYGFLKEITKVWEWPENKNELCK
ncbi:MAG: LysR family transcriptional regulator [Candidatus Paracaedibacter sp.]